MGRHQRGYLYESSGAIFVRYYELKIVDGKPQRIQRSQRLCQKDADRKLGSVSASAVKKLRDEFMRTINEQAPGQTAPNVTVAEFWEKTYLPFAKENLRPYTVMGYVQLWEQRLKAHFGQATLKEYRTHMGSQFLSGLTKQLGRRSLAHLRSLASGIFTHAVNLGFIESNPWHDVKILGKVKAPVGTKHYTLDEAKEIISALAGHADCQLIMALAFFLGLRPGEIAGLRWEDISEGWIHIQRAFVRGNVGPTKTDESVARLPLIVPVLVPLNHWHEESGSPREGWVFPNRFNKPIELRDVIRRVIRPALKRRGLEWKSLYAGRRGAGTILTEITGSAIAAQQILRHKNLAVTTGFYVKQMPEAGLSGMRLLEAKAADTVAGK